jgi:hypothetical protein
MILNTEYRIFLIETSRSFRCPSMSTTYVRCKIWSLKTFPNASIKLISSRILAKDTGVFL